jgi:NIMA (never in mitosis gene a)-related kinase
MQHPNGYYLGSQIDEGGFGKVYHGYYPKLQLHLCTKELELSDSKQKWNANNEIEILKMADHPNIIKYIDDYQFDKKQYIVMELIETGTLWRLIEGFQLEGKPIPEELILKIFSQLISVLKYCYDKRIIHRDVKTNNILYLKSNVVKLADFGIARVLPDDKKELGYNDGSSGGAVAYTSPEVSQNDFYSFPTDVWSLGIVMYQLMTLVLPPKGSNSNKTYQLITNEDYSPEPITGNYSEELKQIVYQMLEKNQYNRIHIDELFENPLFTKINGNEKLFEYFLSALQKFT